MVLEYLIILSEWLCSDIIEVHSLEQVNRSIIYMMKLYKNIVRRDSIHGINISKFHESLHIVRDIHFCLALQRDMMADQERVLTSKQNNLLEEPKKGLIILKSNRQKDV